MGVREVDAEDTAERDMVRLDMLLEAKVWLIESTSKWMTPAGEMRQVAMKLRLSQANGILDVAKQRRGKWGFKTMSGKTEMRAAKRDPGKKSFRSRGEN